MTAQLLLVIVSFCGAPQNSKGVEYMWTQKDRNSCVASILSCVGSSTDGREAVSKVTSCLVR